MINYFKWTSISINITAASLLSLISASALTLDTLTASDRVALICRKWRSVLIRLNWLGLTDYM